MREPVIAFLVVGIGACVVGIVACLVAVLFARRHEDQCNALSAENARLAIGLRCVEAACDRSESHDRIRRIAERALHPLLGYEKDKPNG